MMFSCESHKEANVFELILKHKRIDHIRSYLKFWVYDCLPEIATDLYQSVIKRFK